MPDLNQILKDYDELIGIHQELFQEQAVDRAKRLLDNSGRAEDVLAELVEAISWMRSHDIPVFLQETLSDDTFNYQHEREELLNSRGREVKGYGFHINTKGLFDRSDGVLIPEYLLDGRTLDPRHQEYEQDYYRVCFAKGNIGNLGRYLAGHLFMDSRNDSETGFSEHRFNPDNPNFSQKYKIGVVREPDIVRGGDAGTHTIETRYSLWVDRPADEGKKACEHIGLLESHDKTPLAAVLTIPYTVWTREQIEEYEEEGRKHFQHLEKADALKEYMPLNREEYARVFVAEKKFEQEIMYAISNFIQEQGANV